PNLPSYRHESFDMKSSSGIAFQAITDEGSFKDLLQLIERKKLFGFDVETTSLNPREAAIFGFPVALDSRTGYYIPVNHRGGDVKQLPLELVLKGLKPFLENPKFGKVGQNIK